MLPSDEARIRKAVRRQIIEALRSDLEGGETILKGAWEECGDQAEHRIAEDECRRIMQLIRALP